MPSKSYIVYILLVIGVLVLLNLPAPSTSSIKSGARDNLAPFHTVVDFFATSANELAGSLRELWVDPVDEKEQLEEIARLRQRVSELEQLENENDSLRRMVAFEKRRGGELVMCKVISRGDTSGWWESVRLNRGSRHGIQANMAVISDEGLVGRTSSISDSTCDVLLLTDPLSRVSCRLSKSGVFGVMKGQGVSLSGRPELEIITPARPARIEYISAEKPVYHGEDVRTSGLGGVYPEGLLIGRIGNIRTDDSRLYLFGDVTPAAKLGGLKYVFVVKE